MTALVKQEQSKLSHFSAEQIALVKKTVADKATDTELELFLHLASKYNLDPFAKEIWFIKFGEKDKPQMYTSRDGYLKIAHASGQFDGMESYTIDDDKGNPLKAVCIVYRKDMERPFKAEIKVSEYNKGNGVWKQYPSAMAIKVAEVQALKRAFSISGLITQEELEPKQPSIIPSTAVMGTSEPKEPWIEGEVVGKRKITDKQRLRLFTLAKAEKDKEGLGLPLPRWTDEQIKGYLTYIGYQSSKDIIADDYEMLCDYFISHPGHEMDVEGQEKLEVA